MRLSLDLREECGMTVIIATHHAVVASRSGRVVRLRDGIVDDMTVQPREVNDDLLGEIGRFIPS
jgi:ABC-type lipoprotein export system ATPase subunit